MGLPACKSTAVAVGRKISNLSTPNIELIYVYSGTLPSGKQDDSVYSNKAEFVSYYATLLST